MLSLALLVLSWGCLFRKSSSVTVPSPPPPTPPAEAAPAAVTPRIGLPPAPLESAPIAKTITLPLSNLELGEMYFQVGNYPQAAKALDASVRDPKAKDRDRALFLLGFSRALAGDNSRDLRHAEAHWKRLISEFPNSIYKGPAEFLLGLQAQIEKLRSDAKERDEKIKNLSEELQVLKDIDLQRRPSRPKE